LVKKVFKSDSTDKFMIGMPAEGLAKLIIKNGGVKTVTCN